MIRFHVFTASTRPGLHVWRRNSPLSDDLHPAPHPAPAAGWHVFEYTVDTSIPDSVRCLLFEWDEDNRTAGNWESDAHQHRVPRMPDGRLAGEVWLFHGAARTVTEDPLAAAQDSVRVHLVTASRYVNGSIFIWPATGGDGGLIPATGHDGANPYWDLPLQGAARSFAQFKFTRPTGSGPEYEAGYANRVWVAQDGPEIWTHSDSDIILPAPPIKRRLTAHFRQEIGPEHPPRMRLWQHNSDFVDDSNAEAGAPGWSRHQALLYEGVPYRCQFWNPTLPPESRWEHPDAKRNLLIEGDTELWTLEGDGHVFTAPPVRDREVNVTVAASAPHIRLAPPLDLEVRVNRARAPLPSGAGLSFQAYPEVPMAFRARGSDGSLEPGEPHTVRVPAGSAPIDTYVVLGRPAVLPAPPIPDLFADPPFAIRRPGVWEEGGFLRFALFSPASATAHVTGEWSARPVPLRSTCDGAYWWAQIPVAQVAAALPAAYHGDYHGARYKYLLDGARRVQDPAAGWVEGSHFDGWSRLVRQDAFQWNDGGWQTPPWDHLRLYQLHPKRFGGRQGATPFDRIAHEVDSPGGYLRQLNATALQLMPVNEVGTTNSWGYDPAFFYAVEEDYGGPDGLKRLVDACHRNGKAVLLDVVFNHAATVDNSL